MTSISILGGNALKNDEFTCEPVNIHSGIFVDSSKNFSETIDASGCYVLPGIIDVHGDAFERSIQPRPNVDFPLPIALADVDRQLIANGITTAYHGLTVSWEPGLRSYEAAANFRSDLKALRGTFASDMHLNIRWETFALNHVQDMIDWVQDDPKSVLSLNDHTTAYLDLPKTSSKISRMAGRSGLTEDQCKTLINQVWERRNEVPAAIETICAGARDAGCSVFAHDELTPETRTEHRRLGVSVSEFPMTIATAKSAAEEGEHVVLGAPNIVRGGSQNNAIDARESVACGHCTVLASDYYYPAPLAAAFKLVDDGVLPLEKAWNLISKNAAAAAKLADRGEIAEGMRADCILVDKKTRSIRMVIANGRVKYTFNSGNQSHQV
ncbi:alpha-D-ribose 1-methylphosphonate 5-triphosphate diphosphatase [Roseibium sp.]|uniref:alpha-D-ribose 1-methylphosphonate 5-triphosphate diphosphatase n=1 Tax=Roseibium sp. TaxID=1936156 RepID=UPI003BA8B47D